MAKNYYLNFNELVIAIFNARNQFMHAAVYFPYSKSVQIGGLGIARDGRVFLDYLPKNGYSDSYIYPEQLNKNVYVLKNLPIDYKDAVFLTEKEEVLIFSYDTLDTIKCTINWENHGYYCTFRVIYPDGTFEDLPACDYGKTYCFLRK